MSFNMVKSFFGREYMYVDGSSHYSGKRVIPAYGPVPSLIETALSFLDAVLTVFLLSCSVLIAGKIHPFLLSGHFSSFSITRYSNECAVMQETYVRKQPLLSPHWLLRFENEIAVLVMAFREKRSTSGSQLMNQHLKHSGSRQTLTALTAHRFCITITWSFWACLRWA